SAPPARYSYYTNKLVTNKMRIMKLHLTYRRLNYLIAAFAFLAISSCATVMPFNTSTVIPAAEGKVKIKRDKNENYIIKVNVSNLAPPANLQPSRSTYVVWMDTKNNGTKNLGQMQPSSTILSKAS